MAAHKHPRWAEPTAVYRLYDHAARLLYVGITNSVERRFSEHARDHVWWPDVGSREISWLSDRVSAERIERNVIRDEVPLYNGTDETGRSLRRKKLPNVRLDREVEQAIDRLTSAIADGTYPPDDPLPSRAVLASEHGVSGVAIGLALSDLMRRGMLIEAAMAGRFIVLSSDKSGRAQPKSARGRLLRLALDKFDGRPFTRQDLRELSGRTPSAVSADLNLLVREGMIKCIGRLPGKGRADFFRVVRKKALLGVARDRPGWVPESCRF